LVGDEPGNQIYAASPGWDIDPDAVGFPILKNGSVVMLDNSILVAAHPDDEALWFSSILDSVKEVLICISHVASRPDWTEQRCKCIVSHPIKNLSCLAIQSSEAFDGVNWNSPIITKYGLLISKPGFSDDRYKQSYEQLKKRLEQRLLGYTNIITHNPWGEYGHLEHVQVYRVTKELQAKFGFNIWFSNYCSNRSYPLYLKYASSLDSDFLSLPTNKSLGLELMNLYKKYDCWTWHTDYEWFDRECFASDPICPKLRLQPRTHFPLNIVNI